MYRVIEHADKVELRIKAGSVGWIGFFDRKDEKEMERLKQIRNTLETYGACEVLTTMPDEFFMT